MKLTKSMEKAVHELLDTAKGKFVEGFEVDPAYHLLFRHHAPGGEHQFDLTVVLGPPIAPKQEENL